MKQRLNCYQNPAFFGMSSSALCCNVAAYITPLQIPDVRPLQEIIATQFKFLSQWYIQNGLISGGFFAS